MNHPQVFYTAEWALAMQAAYGASLKPLLLLGYESDELVGVAALASHPAGKHLSFLAANTADYCDFLSAPHTRAEFLEVVFSELRNTTSATMAFANLPADSPTIHALPEQARRHGFHVFVRPAYTCAQIELGSGERRRELKSSLAGKKKFRRYLREMEREGPVTFVHLHSCEQIQQAFPAFARAHVDRFQAMGKVSSLATRERRIFLEELARRFDGGAVVTLSMLKIGQQPVAWNYGFQFHGSWFWYQPTFDGRQQENSPGYCLLSKIVLDACDTDGMHLIDLGLGSEGYKERFGNSERQTLHATVTKSRVRYLREVVRYRSVGALKRAPRVESALRRVLR